MDYGIIIASLLIGLMRTVLVNARQKPLSSYDPYGIGSCRVCGLIMSSPKQLSRSRSKNMIMNGLTVTPTNKYPWMVSLMSAKDNSKICGGAIISSTFILTAGHCIRRNQNFVSQKSNVCKKADGTSEPCYLSGDELVIGFLTKTLKVSPAIKIAEVIPYPKFSVNSGLTNDIGLIRLQGPIVCNAYANPICLPPPNMEVPVNTQVAISGWGTSRPKYETETKQLQEARIIIQEPIKCKFMDFFRPQTAFCMKGGPNQSPCFGDSGGSMFIERKQYFFAIGVASAHSSDMCHPQAAIVYTAIQPYLPWIQKVTGLAPPLWRRRKRIRNSRRRGCSRKNL